MNSRRVLLQLGSGILAFQIVATVVAVAANWPAQFGGVGTDAGAEALSRGTALSAPLLPLAILAAGLACLHRGAVRTGAGILGAVALAMLAGSLGEALAPATPDVPKAVLVASGTIGVVLAAVLIPAAVAAWRGATVGGRRDAVAAAG